MKETKRVWKHFSYSECDAFAAYLEEMALKGWHLKEIGLGMKFQKGEPMKVRYEIEVFTKATKFDMIPAPATEEFAEYCKEAGWEFVCAFQQFCVFRTKDPEVVPIQTDPKQKFDQIYNLERNRRLGDFIAWTLLLCFSFISVLNNPDILFHNLKIALILIVGSTFGIITILLLRILFWGCVSRKKLETGENIFYHQKSIVSKIMIGIVCIVMTVLILYISIYEHNYELVFYFGSTLLIILFLTVLTRTLKLSREHTYLVIVIIIMIFRVAKSLTGTYYFDNSHEIITQTNAPLSISDINVGYSQADGLYTVDTMKEQSILASKTYYWFHTEEDGEYPLLHYAIIDSRYPWVLDLHWKKSTKYYEEYISKEEAEKWDAIAVIQYPEGFYPEYTILYENCMIFFNYEGELTPQTIQTVKEKLVDEVSKEK